jgi:biopolymer transport protein ExbD
MSSWRKQRKRRYVVIPEVSLTPLIDTAWTLLVIFMITAPMLNNAIKVDLPKAALKEGSQEQQRLVVAVDEKGSMFFNSKPVKLEMLAQTIEGFLTSSPHIMEKSVWLRVHGETTTCSTLAKVYEQIKKVGGIENVQIATQKVAATSA